MFEKILDNGSVQVLDIVIFLGMIAVFILSRFLLRSDIAKKEHKGKLQGFAKKDFLVYSGILVILLVYTASLFLDIAFLENTVKFGFSLFILYLLSLVIQRKILLIYGEEIEVSGEIYFRKGYTVSIFSLFVNIFSFFIAVFLCIQIFNLDSFLEVGGLWAGILAFMGFTAPVWAIDMIAGVIMLESASFKVGNVFYIYEHKTHVWIKNISLTEVKCIDLRTGNPIVFRPSQFRSLTLKNLSQGINGKSNQIMREIEIHVGYSVDKKDIEGICFQAYDKAFEKVHDPEISDYFGDEPYRVLEIDEFGDYAVKYKFFYAISSPFYIFKAQRLMNKYLLEMQKEYNIYFSTPDLVALQK
ncbi:mechanosensitive ion channel family protein [Candidatus Gracilibacteria bacterium]|nr:mechanosensitive ion channel family protein [Candidatus Gracilibacteria bacterium]